MNVVYYPPRGFKGSRGTTILFRKRKNTLSKTQRVTRPRPHDLSPAPSFSKRPHGRERWVYLTLQRHGEKRPVGKKKNWRTCPALLYWHNSSLPAFFFCMSIEPPTASPDHCCCCNKIQNTPFSHWSVRRCLYVCTACIHTNQPLSRQGLVARSALPFPEIGLLLVLNQPQIQC